ncbi:MAG: hypothetical protein HY080_16410 [Gammaproteobacteria bacterium]|nr:hypothetical protein [Gammaproteobacteria bacterium]
MNLQFRTLEDLKDIIKEYEGMLMRPTMHLSHPTLYRRRDVAGHEKVIKGVRIKDWFLSEDEKWVMPHDQMGLSFSSTFSNLRNVYKLKGRHNPGKRIHIFWVLEAADLPVGLKFVADSSKKGHYFLTVTEQMLLSQLVARLKIVAHKMSVIRDAGKTL